MPPFVKAYMSRRQKELWSRTADSKDFCDTTFLWDQFWSRFNTISIPIFDADAFFGDALSAAREAENRVQLEELMARKFDERKKEFRILLHDIAHDVDWDKDNLRSRNGQGVAFRICQTGSLDNFLRFLAGAVFGWNDEGKYEPVDMPDVFLSSDKEICSDDPRSFTQPDDCDIGFNDFTDRDAVFDPTRIWPQSNSGRGYTQTDRLSEERVSSLTSDDDLIKVATADRIEASNQDRPIESSNVTPRDSMRDDLITNSSTCKPCLPNTSKTTTNLSQPDSETVKKSESLQQQNSCSVLERTAEGDEDRRAPHKNFSNSRRTAKRLHPEDGDNDDSADRLSDGRDSLRKRRATEQNNNARESTSLYSVDKPIKDKDGVEGTQGTHQRRKLRVNAELDAQASSPIASEKGKPRHAGSCTAPAGCSAFL